MNLWNLEIFFILLGNSFQTFGRKYANEWWQIVILWKSDLKKFLCLVKWEWMGNWFDWILDENPVCATTKVWISLIRRISVWWNNGGVWARKVSLVIILTRHFCKIIGNRWVENVPPKPKLHTKNKDKLNYSTKVLINLGQHLRFIENSYRFGCLFS